MFKRKCNFSDLNFNILRAGNFSAVSVYSFPIVIISYDVEQIYYKYSFQVIIVKDCWFVGSLGSWQTHLL